MPPASPGGRGRAGSWPTGWPAGRRPGLVDLEADEHAGQRGHRGRARVQVRGRGDLEQPLELGRAGHEGQQRRVGLGEAGGEHERCRRTRPGGGRPRCRGSRRGLISSRSRSPTTPKPWASSTYSRASLALTRARKAASWGGLPVIELTPSMQTSRGALGWRRSSRSRASRVVVGVADHGGAVGPGGHAAVPDGLVGPGVHEDGPVRGQHRDHRGVDVGQGRQQQRVGRPQQLGQAGLDLGIQGRVAQHPRPAGMGPPAVQVGGDGLDHLAVQVEAEVVTGGEVDQPALADPDAAPVDLLDGGVQQADGGRTGPRDRRMPPTSAPANSRAQHQTRQNEPIQSYATSQAKDCPTSGSTRPARGPTQQGRA
jgi:hypothetical protein